MKRGRRWSYEQFVNDLLEKHDNKKVGYIVTYDFRVKRAGEMPKQLYRHIKRGIEKGLKIKRLEKSVYETSEAGHLFLVRVVKDLNHGAKTRIYEARLVTVD